MHYQRESIQTALQRLFGPDCRFFSAHNLPALSQLKKIYRKKSMEYHPDRASILGIDEAACTEEFKKLSDAYRLLLPFVNSFRPRFYYAPATPPMKHNTAWTEYRVINKHKLRFCQFLRRKNIIDFSTAIDALYWQMKHRPTVGKIARKKGLLTHEQLLRVFSGRKTGEMTLEAARRLNLLDKAAVDAILFEQQQYNVPIGRYFVEKNILTHKQLHTLLSEFNTFRKPENN